MAEERLARAATEAMTLFDDFPRTDPSPAGPGEDSFTFLNRVDRPYWARVRRLLETWFAEYPRADQEDLRNRFRKRAADQHFAAWWELYLFATLKRLGFGLDVHPTLDGVESRPDFRVANANGSFLVEAATTFSGIVDKGRHGERENWILSAIDQASNPNFFVGLEFEEVGMERPSVSEIVKPLERWLESLDPDAVPASDLSTAPQLELRPRDWAFTLTAIPVKPEARGKPSHRLLGYGPITSGFVNDTQMLRRTLERKAGKYGEPQEPLVVAVLLTSPVVDNEDIENALLGDIAWEFNSEDFQDGRWIRQPNGFWLRGTAPRWTRVSAVITGTGLLPWRVTEIWPRLWPNPWAAKCLEPSLPLSKGIAEKSGRVQYEPADGDLAELFDLPTGWPGPEGPFDDKEPPAAAG